MHVARTAGCACLGVVAALCAAKSPAQSYPVKPIRMIVPFVPGGGADTAGRLFGARLGESVGQQVIIDRNFRRT